MWNELNRMLIGESQRKIERDGMAYVCQFGLKGRQQRRRRRMYGRALFLLGGTILLFYNNWYCAWKFDGTHGSFTFKTTVSG